MNEWETSRSQQKRHSHTLLPDSQGRMVCSSCWKVVIEPITSSDDPRLDGAGFNRSGGRDDSDDYEEFVPMPLPELLIALFHQGPEAGYRRAPAAPYVKMVLHANYPNDDDLWDRLADKV